MVKFAPRVKSLIGSNINSCEILIAQYHKEIDSLKQKIEAKQTELDEWKKAFDEMENI